MPLTLQNPHLRFSIELPSGRWSLFDHNERGGFVEDVCMGARFRVRGRARAWDGALDRTRALAPVTLDSLHGPLQALRLEREANTDGLALTVEFAMPLEQPFFLWRLTAHNRGSLPLRLDQLGMLAAGPAPRARPPRSPGQRSWPTSEVLCSGRVQLHTDPGELAFFTNGWQSWGYTGALGPDDRYPFTRLGPFTTPLKVNRGTPQPRRRGHFASDMFGVLADRTHRTGLLVGFLSQLRQFGSVEAFLRPPAPSLRLWANCDGVLLDPGASLESDWAVLQFIRLDDPDPLGPFMEAAGVEAGARAPADTLPCETSEVFEHLGGLPPVGWCSWYHFFDRVTEADVIANLEAAKKSREALPLSLIQLDDGYQADVGDWFERNDKFPHDLRWLSDRVREAGLTPGLWLAPFAVKPTARINAEHPDWFLRQARDRVVNAGFVFGKWSRALDVTHPEVQAHVRRLIQTAVNDWGFPYLKLDFLYMGALPGRPHDRRLTRAQALRRVLESIREAAGTETFLLGSGCPLGSGVGVFDGMRISADVDPHWEPHYLGTSFYFRSEPDMPAARNAIRNTITRAPMHRRWWLNDPDCLLARDHDTHLTRDEVVSLASVIALSGGMLLVSDDLATLAPERRRLIAPLLPVVERAARAVDWMDAAMPGKLILPMSGAVGDWWVIGLFNWQDRPRRLSLDLAEFGLDPDRPYHALEFWSQRYFRIRSGVLDLGEVAAHSGMLLAVRAVREGQGAQWVGSNLHFTQGHEVISSSIVHRSSFFFRVTLGRKATGWAWLACERTPKTVEVAGKPVRAHPAGGGLYKIPLRIAHEARVLVHMGD